MQSGSEEDDAGEMGVAGRLGGSLGGSRGPAGVRRPLPPAHSKLQESRYSLSPLARSGEILLPTTHLRQAGPPPPRRSAAGGAPAASQVSLGLTRIPPKTASPTLKQACWAHSEATRVRPHGPSLLPSKQKGRSFHPLLTFTPLRYPPPVMPPGQTFSPIKGSRESFRRDQVPNGELENVGAEFARPWSPQTPQKSHNQP